MSELPHLRSVPSAATEIDFTWYELVRKELLGRVVPEGSRVLDVGCGGGEILCWLADRIAAGMGVDISQDCVAEARARAREHGIRGLRFSQADVLDLPSADGAFDVVLCLGDVLSSSTVYGRQDEAVRELWRALAPGGLIVYEGMNWGWEHATSPSWTFFSRTDEGRFVFHRVRRTRSGRETDRAYDVVPDSPVHRWVQDQVWPTSPSGHRVSLDVVEESPIPKQWLKYRGPSRNQFFTASGLARLYRRAGFRDIEVCAYGQTYDVVSTAGLLDEVGPHRERLARAEAELILERRAGAGPWLFLHARK